MSILGVGGVPILFIKYTLTAYG